MNKPHYGLAYPPKSPRWRKRLALVAILLAALYWEYGRYTFEIVEIDDGSAPGNGNIILARYVNGDRIYVKSFLPASNRSVGLILVEPYRTLATGIMYGTDRNGGNSLRLADEFGFFERRCVAIVRWRSGKPSFEGCSRFHNFDSL
jgi:hypothetical protein